MVILIFSVLAVLLVAVIAALALGKLGEAVAPGVPPPVRTASAEELPDRRLQPLDLDELRFDAAVRGYRMEQVDAAIARLRAELETLQGELRERGLGRDVAGDGDVAESVPVNEVAPRDDVAEPESAVEPGQRQIEQPQVEQPQIDQPDLARPGGRTDGDL